MGGIYTIAHRCPNPGKIPETKLTGVLLEEGGFHVLQEKAKENVIICRGLELIHDLAFDRLESM